jgi:hypothetical protein
VTPRACAWLLALAFVPGAQAQSRMESTSAEDIGWAIERGQCGRAVAHLNEGIVNEWVTHYLIGGTMFDEGLCVKPSWERAEQLYLLAYKAGRHDGVLRLIAGLAREGRDLGSALWWTQQQKLSMPADCQLPAEVHGDPERYVAALNAWPAGRLAACAYAVGVMANVLGDMHYSRGMRLSEVTGPVDVVFVPAQSKFEFDLQKVNADRSLRRGKERLMRRLVEAEQFALKRYIKPVDIDPTWQVTGRFVFAIR